MRALYVITLCGLEAVSSSRPLTPSPLCEGGGGVAKRTKNNNKHKLTKTNTIMSGRRPDFDGLKVQEFLTKAQAMAYTMHKSEESFDTYIRPYVHQYRGGNCMLFYVPELRKRMLQMVEIAPSPARNR